jgi:hypothetical protein
MTTMKIDRCKRCGAEIIWANNTSTGRTAPLDARPVREDYGNIDLDKVRMTYVVLEDEVAASARERQFELYTNHLGTCPYQEEARQKAAECRQAEWSNDEHSDDGHPDWWYDKGSY